MYALTGQVPRVPGFRSHLVLGPVFNPLDAEGLLEARKPSQSVAARVGKYQVSGNRGYRTEAIVRHSVRNLRDNYEERGFGRFGFASYFRPVKKPTQL